jgi:hypothetical protein
MMLKLRKSPPNKLTEFFVKELTNILDSVILPLGSQQTMGDITFQNYKSIAAVMNMSNPEVSFITHDKRIISFRTTLKSNSKKQVEMSSTPARIADYATATTTITQFQHAIAVVNDLPRTMHASLHQSPLLLQTSRHRSPSRDPSRATQNQRVAGEDEEMRYQGREEHLPQLQLPTGHMAAASRIDQQTFGRNSSDRDIDMDRVQNEEPRTLDNIASQAIQIRNGSEVETRVHIPGDQDVEMDESDTQSITVGTARKGKRALELQSQVEELLQRKRQREAQIEGDQVEDIAYLKKSANRLLTNLHLNIQNMSNLEEPSSEIEEEPTSANKGRSKSNSGTKAANPRRSSRLIPAIRKVKPSVIV